MGWYKTLMLGLFFGGGEGQRDRTRFKNSIVLACELLPGSCAGLREPSSGVTRPSIFFSRVPILADFFFSSSVPPYHFLCSKPARAQLPAMRGWTTGDLGRWKDQIIAANTAKTSSDCHHVRSEPEINAKIGRAGQGLGTNLSKV